MMKVLLYKSEIQHDQQYIQLYILSSSFYFLIYIYIIYIH